MSCGAPQHTGVSSATGAKFRITKSYVDPETYSSNSESSIAPTVRIIYLIVQRVMPVVRLARPSFHSHIQ